MRQMRARLAQTAAVYERVGTIRTVSDCHGERWTLHGRDGLVADLVVTGGDFPWLYARLEPHDGWAEIQPLFAEEAPSTGLRRRRRRCVGSRVRRRA
jgi:hypothetical protein